MARRNAPAVPLVTAPVREQLPHLPNIEVDRARNPWRGFTVRAWASQVRREIVQHRANGAGSRARGASFGFGIRGSVAIF
jgi:hypothetical protein